MSASKDTIVFITPVYQRYEITAITLKQRRWMCNELEREGINATCVVIGDDDNLEIAKSLDFPVVVRDNQYLGRKFNDGHEYAYKHGGTYTAPVGSDSWIHPAWLIDSLPKTRAILVSRHYAIVHKTGMKRAQLHIPYVSYVIPVSLLASCNYRPIMETRPKGCDTNTMASLEMDGKGPVRKITSKNSHELDTVAFQSPTQQITDYNRIYGRWGVRQTWDPFNDLKEIFPVELVEEMEALYNVNNLANSYELLEQVIPYVKRVRGQSSDDLLLAIDACLTKAERERDRDVKTKS